MDTHSHEAEILRDYIISTRSEGPPTYPDGITKDDKRQLRRKASNFTVVDMVLFHRGMGGRPQRAIIGEEEKAKVMKHLHLNPDGGSHSGVTKTAKTVAERYYWKVMVNDINDFCGKCDVCQKNNPNNLSVTAELHPIKVGPLFEGWGIDIIGTLSKTTSGNKYIITATEYLSKWAQAKAIPAKTADATSKFLLEIIRNYGCPAIIQTDQGREFVNNVNDNLCKQLDIKHKISTAYHPQTNGLVERFNQTLSTQLMKVANAEDWDEHIASIIMSYNFSCQGSTKFSPYFVLFGIHPRYPIQLDLPTEANAVTNDHTAELKQRIDYLSSADNRQHAANNIRTSQAKQKTRYDLKHHGPQYEVGQKVLLQSTRKRSRKGDKLQNRYTGPYEVPESVGKGTYVLKSASGKIMSQKVAATRLRAYKHDAEVECIEVVKKAKYMPFKPLDETQQQTLCQNLHLQHKCCPSYGSRKMVSIDSVPSTQPIVGDGNCLFRAISFALTGAEAQHREVREMIVEHLEENSETFEDSVGEIFEGKRESVAEYLYRSDMRKPQIWGGSDEMKVAANLFDLPIFCHSAGGWEPYYPNLSSPAANNWPNDNYSAVIYLAHDRNHFELVLDLESGISAEDSDEELYSSKVYIL